MSRHRMFKFVRESVDEVPGLEKWTLKQLVNPADPESTRISSIKVAMAWETFGEFWLENTVLAISQEHRFGQPPRPVCFSLPQDGVFGDSIIYSIKNGKMALLAGEIGSPEGRMYQMPSPAGASQAVVEWIEGLSENTCWDA